MRQVVVCGDTPLTQAVAGALVQASTPMRVGGFALPEALATALETLAKLHLNAYQSITGKGLGEADIIVFTDFEEGTLEAMRGVLNQAMEAGFAGQVVIATHQDDQATYFAQRFSGLSRQAIVGLGTMGLTTCFEAALAQALDVPKSRVTAYALGTMENPVLLWSRAYVGVTPVLRLVPPEAQAELFQTVQQACEAYAVGDAALLWPPLVVRLVQALSGAALLTPVMAVATTEDGATITTATPLVVDDAGVRRVAVVNGTEAENQALAQVAEATMVAIAEIESGDEADET